jgi:hypothetical protein
MMEFMIKSFWQVLIAMIFLVSACAPSVTNAPIAATQNVTAIPSQTPTVSQTPLPSSTPTESITPLPTIPSFTPTFDARTIVTVTPAPKAECPQLSNPSQVDFAVYPSGQKYVDHPTIAAILDFLNLGGQMKQLDAELSQIGASYNIKDITNDSIPDLVVISGSLFQTVNILWCQNGRYNSLPKDITEGETLGSDHVKFELHDLNQNGIPEVLSIGSGRTGISVNVLEWNGQTFRDLSADQDGINAIMAHATDDGFSLKDLNNDGISELILRGFTPGNWEYPGDPLRAETAIYYWNGTRYSPIKTFNAPQYRFQAIQDADMQTLQGNYLEAIKFYHETIDSDKLDWWSQERFENNKAANINLTTPSPLATNLTEYPKLAAYAYYRIILLHLVQNHEPEATTVYNTLQKKFSNDPYGSPYVEMAAAFWEAYQSTHKMYDGCAAAIQYAAEHPEILTPLGSDYHGSQSHSYVPADVCPFR